MRTASPALSPILSPPTPLSPKEIKSIHQIHHLERRFKWHDIFPNAAALWQAANASGILGKAHMYVQAF